MSKFGRKHDQRRALMKSLASSFFLLGRIRTTEAKAKALRPFVERCLSRAKLGTLHDRRYLRRGFSEEITHRMLEKAAALTDRRGGYTRIMKIGPRKSDGARMAIIELVK